ncbi:Bax inhibitor 1 [Branchiostoma belcheri]|nr:Bax inhibitor 1 [Branchiostoma belcheri]
MTRKLPLKLIFLIIILRTPTVSEAICSCYRTSWWTCQNMDLIGIPRDLPKSMSHLHLGGPPLPVLIGSVCGQIAGIALIAVVIIAALYKRRTGNPLFKLDHNTFVFGRHTKNVKDTDNHQDQIGQGQSQAITESNTSTITECNTIIITESNTNTITESNTNTITESNKNTITESNTDTITESNTSTITESNTSTITESNTSTITESNTNTITESDTNTITESNTSTITESNTNTITESNTNTITESNTNTITESNTSTITESNTSTITESNTNTITESNTNTITESNTNTTSTVHVVTSGYDQTEQCQAQVINETLDAKNKSYGTGTTASQVNPMHKVVAQSQATTESLDAKNISYGTGPTASERNSFYKVEAFTESYTNITSSLMTSGHDQTGQGQSLAITESLDARNVCYDTAPAASQLNSLYANVEIP